MRKTEQNIQKYMNHSKKIGKNTNTQKTLLIESKFSQIMGISNPLQMIWGIL